MKGLAAFLGGALTGVAVTALFTTSEGAGLRERIRTRLVNRGIIEPDRVDEFISMVAQEIKD